MGMQAVDFRFADLWPDVPIADDCNTLEIYADGISDLRVHGVNFTINYFTWGRSGPAGIVRRVPVVKVIRPLNSACAMWQTLKGLIERPTVASH